MNVKLLLHQQVRDHLNIQRGLLVLVFFLLTAFGAQAQNAYTDAGLPVPTVTSDKDDYAPGEIAIITGSGWTLDSLVDIHLEEDPAHEHHHSYHDTKVNPDGTWRIEYPIEERHLGVAFTVIVNGKQTGAEASAIFTDALQTKLEPASGTSVFYNSQTNLVARLTQVNGGNAGAGQGNGVPGATVIFYLRGIGVGSAITDSYGFARLSVTIPSVINAGYYSGGYSIVFYQTKEYNQTSTSVSLNVEKLPTYVKVASVVGTYEGNVDLRAQLSTTNPGSKTITFKLNGNVVGTALTDNYGTAILNANLGTIAVGSYADGFTAEFAGETNYRASADSDMLTVRPNQAITSFSNLSEPTITYRTPSTTFGGVISSTNGVPSGSVAVTLNGYTQYAPINSTTGAFSTDFTTSALGVASSPYAINYAYAATTNFTEVNDDSKSLTVTKAPTTTVVTVSDATYNGSPIEGSARVTGAGGLDAAVTVYYAGVAPTVYASSTSAPTNAGTYTAKATYAESANHLGSSKSENFAIGKAEAIVNVTGYEGTYDGAAHGATGTAKGVKGETLAGLDLGASFTNAPGGTASWTFTDATGNYNNASGTATVAIGKKEASVVVAAQIKEYGAADPVFTGTLTGFITADNVTASYARVAGETVAGGPYAITATLSPAAVLGNYEITNTPSTLRITAKPITVAADAQKKMESDADPALSYRITSGSLVSGDDFAGSLTRIAGEGAGTYAINQGTLTLGANYNLSFVGAALTIFSAPTVALVAMDPVQIGTPSTITATFGGDVFNKVWTVVSPGGAVATYPVSGNSYTISSPTVGVYTVSMTYENGIGQSFPSDKVFAVFYDPSAGFVTGGGWIDSPEKAYTANPAATGRANFGFVSKYEKGAKIPTGNTEFQFKAGDLNFKSTNYQWLTVSGARAQFKGTGTINGAGSYGFMLTAIDGQVTGGGGVDKFRIKITDAAGNPVYDNELGTSDDAAISTAVTGSIVIHQPAVKATNTKTVIADETVVSETLEATKFSNYPNPYNDRTTITFSTEKEESFALEVYDVKGALVKKVDMGVTEAGKVYAYDFEGRNLPVGVYFARLITASDVQTIKMVLKR